MENKIVMGAITATIVIILVASALIPVIDDAATIEEKFTNEGYFSMAETSDADYILEWDYSAPTQVTVNGDVVDLSALQMSRDYTIFGSSNMLVRYVYRSDGSGYGINAFPGAGGNISASEGATRNFSLAYTASTNTVVLTGSSSATQVLDGEVYAIDHGGDYVMKFADEPVHVLGSSPIVGIGRTSLAGATISTWLSAMGGIDNGLDIVFFNSTPEGTTAGDVTITKTDISGFIDLYTVTNFKFPITQGDNTATAVYSYFIVPAEVVAERSEHATPGQAALYKAIPVLVFVALLVGVLGYGIYRYRD